MSNVETGELLLASSQEHPWNPNGAAPSVHVRMVSNPVHQGPPMNGYDGKHANRIAYPKLILQWTVRTDLVRTVQADQRFIITGSYDKSLKVFDRNTGHLLCHIVGAQ